MNDNNIETVRENYDRLAREYANRIFDELQHKPLDRELLGLLLLVSDKLQFVARFHLPPLPPGHDKLKFVGHL